MKNENEDSPRKEINTTKHFWLIFFFNLEKHYTIMLCHAKSLQSAHQAPLSRTFSRQEYWSGLPFPSPGCLSHPGTEPSSLKSPALADGFLPLEPPAGAKLLQSCPTLCDPIDGSSPGSPVPGILQARTLEWVAISFSSA